MRGHPGEYKIGRTNLVDRRMTELGAKAAIEHEVVHLIKTDDPVGVEAYWHARFEKAGKRMRGEWFRLQAADAAPLQTLEANRLTSRRSDPDPQRLSRWKLS